MRKTIFLVAGGIFSTLLISWWLQRRIDVATGKVAEAAASLKYIQEQNAAQFEIMGAQVVAIEQERDKLQATNITLRGRIIEREQVIRLKDQQLQERQNLALTSPLLDITNRWADLAKVPPAEIRLAPDDNILVTDLAARRTVSLLEELPVIEEKVISLELDKVDLREQITNEMRIVEGWQNQCRLCNEKQTLLDKQHAAELEVVSQQLVLEKAKGRRNTLRGFVIGAIAGAVAMGVR